MATSLELDFDLPCTPEAAFAAWTQAALVTQWWGEAGVYRTTAWSAELTPGGAWRAEVDDGGATAEGRYLTVDAPSRLVWTWRASWAPDDETTIDMSFTPTPGGTRLRMAQGDVASTEELEENEAAWRQVVGWLQAHLDGARA